MIQYDALFKVSYGLYIVASGTKEKGNGYISNTVFQVSSSPPRFATCCNKDNHTATLIASSGYFSVSVLPQDCSSDLIGNFGYKSGKDTDKLEGRNIRYGEGGVPVVLDEAIAVLEFRVEESHDLGSHMMFIGELLHAEILDDGKEPLTYLHYRNVKKGKAPKNAPTFVDESKLEKKSEVKDPDKYVCPACGYVYDEAEEEPPFGELPDGWTCPVCGVEKEDFFKQ